MQFERLKRRRRWPCRGLAIGALAFTTVHAMAGGPILGLKLPEQVPYLNPIRPKQVQYCLGNGIVAALADPDGKWNQLFGPGYGGKNAVLNETLDLIVDGKPAGIKFEMKRARKTGVFYASTVIGDIHCLLIDNARFGDPWLSRLILVENTSSTAAHDVVVQAALHGAQAALKDHKSIPCGYKCNGVAVTFTDPGATVSADANTIATAPAHLLPGASAAATLVHYAGDGNDREIVYMIRGMNGLDLASQSIAAWQAWYNDVPPAYQLDRIADPRARDLVEGGLEVLKANQSADGGFMATPTMYRQGYIRDSVMALRGLHETGHFEEARKWIQWCDLQFRQRQCIYDRWNLAMCLLPTPGYGSGDFESCSLPVLAARDYYRATSDLKTLNQAGELLRYCIDRQLKYAAENDYHLHFNGDETEICHAVPFHMESSYSMPSAALLAAAVDFYIEYLKANAANPSAYINSQSKLTVDLHSVLDRLEDSINANFWRTDVTGIPGGFHDSYRGANGDWPKVPIVNFTLHPIYWGAPYKIASQRKSDAEAMLHFYDHKTGFIQLFPGLNNGFDGHNLGFLLYALADVNDPAADEVYRSLTHGPTNSWLGYWNEAYAADGTPHTAYSPGGDNGLRSLETGVNISAIAHYCRLGKP